MTEQSAHPANESTMRRPWQGRRVVLGVTGGIAAYKVIQVARDLTRLGAEVDVVLTRGAQHFVTPLTFEGLTGRRVLTELFSTDGAAMHIRLGFETDVVCVAPATADFISRAAQGRADDLLTTTLLATRAPVVLCPAMNDRMYSHPQTQANVGHVREVLGYTVAGPAVGPLAVGEGEGPGRLLEPEEIIQEIGRALSRTDESSHAWRGRRVLVTAGPTHEPIDPVRYVGNRSSGRMGYALAQAAWRRGADVTVVAGPGGAPVPYGPEVVPVSTAVEMSDAVQSRIGESDLAVFAAAVADYRPADPRGQKLKRSTLGDAVSLDLTENPDVAKTSLEGARPGSLRVGFALETEDLLENARDKMERKGFDIIVANAATRPGAGFEVDTNVVTILSRGSEPEALPLMSKDEVAERILDQAQGLFASAGGSAGV
jgi:phosphopantothenoylcysteine decarboxylase / phosphopantothenate---cysteine ligase